MTAATSSGGHGRGLMIQGIASMKDKQQNNSNPESPALIKNSFQKQHRGPSLAKENQNRMRQTKQEFNP